MAPHARLLWKSLVFIHFSLPSWVESESRGDLQEGALFSLP